MVARTVLMGIIDCEEILLVVLMVILIIASSANGNHCLLMSNGNMWRALLYVLVPTVCQHLFPPVCDGCYAITAARSDGCAGPGRSRRGETHLEWTRLQQNLPLAKRGWINGVQTKCP